MNWIVQIAGAVAGILAVTGVVLNNHRLRWCFVVWLVSNGISGGIHAWSGLWTLAARDVVFFGLAADGWFRWGRIERKAAT